MTYAGVVKLNQVEVFGVLETDGGRVRLGVNLGEWATLGFAEGQTLSVDLPGSHRWTLYLADVAAKPGSARTWVMFAPPVARGNLQSVS